MKWQIPYKVTFDSIKEDVSDKRLTPSNLEGLDNLGKSAQFFDGESVSPLIEEEEGKEITT